MLCLHTLPSRWWIVTLVSSILYITSGSSPVRHIYALCSPVQFLLLTQFLVLFWVRLWFQLLSLGSFFLFRSGETLIDCLTVLTGQPLCLVSLVWFCVLGWEGICLSSFHDNSHYQHFASVIFHIVLLSQLIQLPCQVFFLCFLFVLKVTSQLWGLFGSVHSLPPGELYQLWSTGLLRTCTWKLQIKIFFARSWIIYWITSNIKYKCNEWNLIKEWPWEIQMFPLSTVFYGWLISVELSWLALVSKCKCRLAPVPNRRDLAKPLLICRNLKLHKWDCTQQYCKFFILLDIGASPLGLNYITFMQLWATIWLKIDGCMPLWGWYPITA